MEQVSVRGDLQSTAQATKEYGVRWFSQLGSTMRRFKNFVYTYQLHDFPLSDSIFYSDFTAQNIWYSIPKTVGVSFILLRNIMLFSFIRFPQCFWEMETEIMVIRHHDCLIVHLLSLPK